MEEEFKECSVIAYPREIRFLHKKGGYIRYCVDRSVSDYVNKLQKENQQLKEQLEKEKQIRKDVIDIIENKFLESTLESYVCLKVEDYLKIKDILDIDKGE